MATRGSYVHNSMVKFEAILKMLVLCNFLQILMVSDKTIHKACRTHATLYKQNPLEKFLIFTIHENYTLALSTFINWQESWCQE